MNITAKEKAKATITVNNMQGQVLKTNAINVVAGSQTQTIDCSNLSKGVYLITVLVNNNKEVFKLLKQ